MLRIKTYCTGTCNDSSVCTGKISDFSSHPMKGGGPSDDEKTSLLIELQKSPCYWDWKVCTSVEKSDYEEHGMEFKAPGCPG